MGVPYAPATDSPALNALLIAALALGSVRAFPPRHALEESVANAFPHAAVEYLRQHPYPNTMFNDLGFGGYLLYGLGPRHRVFIDGRLDIYSYAGVLSDYLRITQLDSDALRLLDRYKIQSCLIPPHVPLVTLLAASSEWQQVYRDPLSVLFVRRGRRPENISGSVK